ncbi:MAG: SRPBCC domain-containing protein [Candidatus Binatus sp.]
MTIRKSIWVERGREIAFHVFCTEIGAWWPGGFGGDDIIMTLETRVGGRLFEKRADGTEYVIGLVTTYEPPKAVAFTWRAPSWELTTQVEVRFIADGTGTRIELEHSGFDQDEKLRDARKSYDGGWEFVLGRYQSKADAPA